MPMNTNSSSLQSKRIGLNISAQLDILSAKYWYEIATRLQVTEIIAKVETELACVTLCDNPVWRLGNMGQTRVYGPDHIWTRPDKTRQKYTDQGIWTRPDQNRPNWSTQAKIRLDQNIYTRSDYTRTFSQVDTINVFTGGHSWGYLEPVWLHFFITKFGDVSFNLVTLCHCVHCLCFDPFFDSL